MLTRFPALIRTVLSGDLRPVICHHGDLGLNCEAPKGGVDLGPCGTGFDTAKIAARTLAQQLL